MSAYADALARYVAAPPVDQPQVAAAATTAAALVEQLCKGATVPDDVKTAAVMEVGANLYARRQSRRDMATWTENGLMESPRVPALDPLTPAYPILKPYLDPAVA